MKFAKRLLTVAGAVALAGILGAMMSPKIAHAVSALVTVANTSANPVPTVATDNQALLPFSAETIDRSGGLCFDSITLPSTTSTGASVRSVVIEEVSAHIDFSGAVPVGVRVVDSASNGGTELYVPFQTGINESNEIELAHQTRLYEKPGTTVDLNLTGSTASANTCSFSVFGYLVTN